MGISKFTVRNIGSVEDILWASGIAYDKEKTKNINSLFGQDFHESPFRHLIIKGELKCPMFVANQLKRHKEGMEFVEVSRRYTTLKMEDFYIPKDKTSVMGRIYVKRNTEKALEIYNDLLKFTKKEQARMVLPQNMHVKMRMTFSLSWLLRVLKQRFLNEHAQAETIATVSTIMSEITKDNKDIEKVIEKYIEWLNKK
ncbi:MAG TPA: FAD-dependent thymidylate synthase [Bacteroidales bacterium]|nr:FAD-dependent thymidylate synthase [Bacteroidales bacterium]